MGIKERLFSKTPPFFRKLRTIGLVLIAAGSATSTVHLPLPAIISEISAYMIVAGSVMVAVCQAVVKKEEEWATTTPRICRGVLNLVNLFISIKFAPTRKANTPNTPQSNRENYLITNQS